jgi:hypothetical protein
MPEETANITAASFQLKGIELLKGSLNLPPATAEAQTNFNFGINIEAKANQGLKLVFIVVHVDISESPQQILLGSLSVSCIYEVQNYEQVVTHELDGKIKVNNQLLGLLNSISISTTRGVMFAMFKGTYLHNAFLPVVDPTQFKIT